MSRGALSTYPVRSQGIQSRAGTTNVTWEIRYVWVCSIIDQLCRSVVDRRRERLCTGGATKGSRYSPDLFGGQSGERTIFRKVCQVGEPQRTRDECNQYCEVLQLHPGHRQGMRGNSADGEDKSPAGGFIYPGKTKAAAHLLNLACKELRMHCIVRQNTNQPCKLAAVVISH